jgi:hypothetical protein
MLAPLARTGNVSVASRARGRTTPHPLRVDRKRFRPRGWTLIEENTSGEVLVSWTCFGPGRRIETGSYLNGTTG